MLWGGLATILALYIFMQSLVGLGCSIGSAIKLMLYSTKRANIGIQDGHVLLKALQISHLGILILTERAGIEFIGCSSHFTILRFSFLS